MRTANPALRDDIFSGMGYGSSLSNTMTVQGTVNKTGILLACTLVAAFYTWSLFFSGSAAAVQGWMMGGMIIGLITAMVTIFKQTWAPYTAPVYALAEGFFLGGVSAFFEQSYPGIAMQAIGLTFGVMGCLLMLYKSGVIQVTEKFRMGVFAATGAIALVYLVSFVLSFFSISVPLIHSSGIGGIIFSLVVVGVAALNLVLDFDFIERGEARGAPKYMEWYAAFGLMVTLIWLYLELLRLLAKMRDNR